MIDLIEKKYNEFVDHNFITKDNFQIKILKKINSTWTSYNTKNFFRNLFRNKSFSNGIYLFGSVGIGKTFLINIFIKSFRNSKKFHFNHFMNELHSFINIKKNRDHSLDSFIKSISLKYKIIFIDELHIYNIVDALIIKKVFLLFKRYKVFVIVSSNFKPEDLYENGLQRNDFVPFIEFINKEFKVIFFDQNKDYRRQLLNQSKTYFTPINKNTESEFKILFNKFVDSEYVHEKKIKIKSREITISKCLANIALCTFNELCCENLGPEDYQKLASEFNLFFIERVPKFNKLNSNECRRFINLIDMLYDQQRSVVILAENPINKLCSIQKLNKEFERTASRLYEMTIIRTH